MLLSAGFHTAINGNLDFHSTELCRAAQAQNCVFTGKHFGLWEKQVVFDDHRTGLEWEPERRNRGIM